MLVPVRLNQDVDHVAVLIHGAPQILLLAVDSNEDFIQVPGHCQVNGNSESTTAILAGIMSLIELSVTEVKYLAKMNCESILVMHTIGKKNNTVLPDLRVAEGIQAKFAAVLPSGLPDPFAELRAAQSRKAQRGKATSRTGAKRK